MDMFWTEQQQAAAQADGWQLCLVVDEGKSIATAYLVVFDYGPRFSSRSEAAVYVINTARTQSKLHLAAMVACQQSRTHVTPTKKAKRKT